MSEKIDISKLKKTELSLEKRNKISDDELSNVSGGYQEWGGYAAGYEIKCPVCGRDQPGDFEYEEHNDANVNGYKCVCGHVFGVDSNGAIWQ